MSLLRSPLRLAIILALLIGGVWAALTLRLETEVLQLMPTQLPSVRGLREFQERFGSERELYLVADPKMPEPDRRAAFEKLRPVLAGLPGVEAVVAPDEEFGRNWPVVAGWALSNLPPERFQRGLEALAPERSAARLTGIPAA